ncbi:MAG: PhoH family protein [Nitrospinota bacterium]|nr:PhoH family protein [Nitrospinota bacterium]
MAEYELECIPRFQEIAGVNNRNIKRIEKLFEVAITTRGGKVKIQGDGEGAQNAAKLLDQLFALAESGVDITNGALTYVIPTFRDDPKINLKDILSDKIHIATSRREIYPRSAAQREYIIAMNRYDVVLSTGPAGTGKTYLAMACAVNDLLTRRVSRIILTRPAVEAGEKLGFLPGDLYEKINPYLRPLHDALFDMLEANHIQRLTEQGAIEIAPLAYMRGRTLNDAFIILDEAQNATPDQIKMLLTRLGVSSKVVITGDATQVDLPSKKDSGLAHANRALGDVQGIKLVGFTEKDVVRHELVKRILKAYQAAENTENLEERI